MRYSVLPAQAEHSLEELRLFGYLSNDRQYGSVMQRVVSRPLGRLEQSGSSVASSLGSGHRMGSGGHRTGIDISNRR